jgi:CRP-like cAMP-binding protein
MSGGGDSRLGAREALSRDARRETLMASRLFRLLPAKELESVLDHAVMRRYARNEIVMRKADPGTGMALIVTGRVRIGSTAIDGREVSLGVLGPGEVLGEISLLDGGARSADVIALDDCVMVTVDRDSFLRLLRGNAELCLSLMGYLCERLRRTNMSMEELALLDLPERLGGLLLRLARDYGRPVAAGTRIELKLSQKDLSTLIGASREKVNRQLRAWEADGVIAIDAGRVVLQQPERFGES